MFDGFNMRLEEMLARDQCTRWEQRAKSPSKTNDPRYENAPYSTGARNWNQEHDANYADQNHPPLTKLFKRPEKPHKRKGRGLPHQESTQWPKKRPCHEIAGESLHTLRVRSPRGRIVRQTVQFLERPRSSSLTGKPLGLEKRS